MKYTNSNEAPAAIGPYSQAVLAGKTLYTSGQIAITASGESYIGKGIEKETHQVMRNLNAILQAAGFSFAHVVKSSIFIIDIDDFSLVNEIYASYLSPTHLPSRETVQVAKLPKNASIEISMVAYKDEIC